MGDAILLKHPSPCFVLIIDSLKIELDDFYVNGEAVDENYTHSLSVYELNPPVNMENPYSQTFHVIPNQASNIDTGEEVTVSCTFKAEENTTSRLILAIKWSPDGNIRYRPWYVLWKESAFFPKYESKDVPSFSFVSIMLIIPLLLILKRKRNNSR